MNALRRPPTLPFNFHWVLPGELAGMGWPDHLPPFTDSLGLDETVRALRGLGVRAVVSLTEYEPGFAKVAAHGLTLLHVPIVDMTAPDLEQVRRVCEFTDALLRPAAGSRQGAVAYHCLAGIGRTGTLLACYLVHLGTGGAEALRQVRRVYVDYVQTRTQERCVLEFAASLGR